MTSVFAAGPAAGRLIVTHDGLSIWLRTGAWATTIVGVAAVVLLVGVIYRLTRKGSSSHDPPGSSPDEGL